MSDGGTVDIHGIVEHAKSLLRQSEAGNYNMPFGAHVTIRDLLGVIEELMVRDIQARNPGIDADEVRRHRASQQSAQSVHTMKVAVCEYLLEVNRDHDGPFIPPTAIDWLGNGIVSAIEAISQSGGIVG